MALPYRSDRTDTLALPLRSDPPWLTAGVAGLTLLFAAVFVFLFSRTRLSPALGLLPALSLAVFGGAGLAAWSRRRGGTLSLELSPHRLDVRDPSRRQELLDLGAGYSAALVVGRHPGRRMLVLVQNDTPIVVLEASAATTPAPGRWQDRTLTVDLDQVPLSPASAGVVTLAVGASLDPLLERLEASLSPESPLVFHRTAAGPLVVTRESVRLGDQSVPLDPRRVVPYALQVKGGAVAALGFLAAEAPVFVLACEDAATAPDAVPVDQTPDAYIPLSVFELLRALCRS